MRAKEDWVGVRAGFGQEFIAHCEVQRFCLTAYLPQRKQRMWAKGVMEPLLYARPLIRGRLLMPLIEARDRALHYVRGLRGPKFLVEDLGRI
jgi:hypothetical protein